VDIDWSHRRPLRTSPLRRGARPERKTARRERNAARGGRDGRERKSAGIRESPRKHAGMRKKKGQQQTVDLYILVEPGGIEPTASRQDWGEYVLRIKTLRPPGLVR